MDAGAWIRSLPLGVIRRRRPTSEGYTSSEVLVVLGIVGLLCAAGLAVMEPTGVDLTTTQHEIQGCLDQAFQQARAQGRNVTIAPGRQGGEGVLPLQLPRSVKWGKPAHVPLPPGMDDPKVADIRGEAHPRITVTPHRTATATAWFFHDGRESLCVRLSGKGRLQMFRYRLRSRRWERV